MLIMNNVYKQALRESIKSVRRKLGPPFVHHASELICKKIKTLDSYRYAKHIALYHACDGEIDLRNIWEKAPFQGKFCYFPCVQKNGTMIFLPATPVTPFKKNAYNILEPDIDLSLAVELEQLDIIFTPLVAFDSHGTRIGAGGGFYDKTFAKTKHPALIGVAYDFQYQAYLNPCEWDVSLSQVITPTTTYRINNV